jgi:lysophospholipase L1-like esterase
MKFTSIVSASTLFYQSITGMVLRQEGQEKPPHFILTGDSTVAIDGGWGNGFLAATKDPAGGINLAKGGATTASFRAEGLWGAALHSVKDNVDNSQPIVTIQFGHNDQKETSGLTPEQFKANLVTMAAEVLEAGGTPVRKGYNTTRMRIVALMTRSLDHHNFSHPTHLSRWSRGREPE